MIQKIEITDNTFSVTCSLDQLASHKLDPSTVWTSGRSTNSKQLLNVSSDVRCVSKILTLNMIPRNFGSSRRRKFVTRLLSLRDIERKRGVGREREGRGRSGRLDVRSGGDQRTCPEMATCQRRPVYRCHTHRTTRDPEPCPQSLYNYLMTSIWCHCYIQRSLAAMGPHPSQR